MNVSGNKILITGATRGIGLALTDALYKLDNEIIAVARNEERLMKLKKQYPDITTLSCDLTDESSIDAMVCTVKKGHSDLNMLINNAGVQVNFYGSLFGEDVEKLNPVKKEIQVNYASVVELTFRFIPILLQHSSAAIVNVSSGLAFAPKKSAPVYCGTKAAIHIFTKALRYQYENTSLKVFEMIPPLVDTDMTNGRGKDKISPEQLVKQFLRSLKSDNYEINIGKTKLLRLIKRIAPKVADGILKNN